jgi:hypothetical protein
VESTVDPSVITELRKTPLNAMHRRLGAKMVNFGGWDMPVEYPSTGGLVAEHKTVRGGVGVFDVSHMGDIRIATARSHGGAQSPISVQLHGNLLSFSGHGYQLKIRHRLPGNPGSNTAHPCRVARQADLGKWCSTFRTCNALPFYHTGHTRPERAWEPPEKLYLRTYCRARHRQTLMRELNSCTTRLFAVLFDPLEGAC